MNANQKYLVAVIGAGPAGLYAAQSLGRKGVQVVLFNRDIKPGGLAEYGIFPDKHKMRDGLMAHFRRILDMPNVVYQGNMSVGQSGDIRLDQLRRMGFQAFMVTTGAQENNWLGIPGEDLNGVYHANSIVFHYNHLPAYNALQFDFGQRVAVIGVGNVMLDIVHFIKRIQHPCTVTAYGRRGPTEVKFDIETLEPVAGCLNMAAIRDAVDQANAEVVNVGKDSQNFFSMLTGARDQSIDCPAGLNFEMKFLRTPRRLLGGETSHQGQPGRVCAIEFEINRLRLEHDQVVSYGTGVTEIVPVDTVVFSIGSHVDPGFGLPVERGNYMTSAEPRYPIDGISYEVYNPDLCTQCEDIFVSGWARLASEGIVGLAKKDAERGARALMHYLETLAPVSDEVIGDAFHQIKLLNRQVVDLADLKRLWQAELNMAERMGQGHFKFETNEAMLKAIEKDS